MLALIDIRATQEIKDRLLSLGFNVLSVPQSSRLDIPVSAHPDMRLFALGRKIFISKDEKTELLPIAEKLAGSGYEIIYSSATLSKKYPHDIAFNCFTVGKYLFGNLPYVAREILEVAEKEGYALVPVKQGYAKCSTVIVDDRSIITADPSIYGAAIKAGIDALLINDPDGAIRLPGYSCGFIGGASGMFENTVYFCGNIELHPDAETIKAFCKSKNKTVLSLSKEPLYDLGSILFFN